MCSYPYSVKSLPFSLGGVAVLSNTCIAVRTWAASLSRLLIFLIEASTFFLIDFRDTDCLYFST